MLCKNSILEKTNQGLSVFRYYISGDWSVGKNFKNPFYNDTKASFNIYFDKKRQQYQMKDFGNEVYSGDCFVLVGLIMGLDSINTFHFIEIMKQIDCDLHLGLDENATERKFIKPVMAKVTPICCEQDLQQEKPFSYKQKKFSNQELSFWQEYGISQKVLDKFFVISLETFQSINRQGHPYRINYSSEEPIFAYRGHNYLKLYRPFSKIKFLYGGVIPETYCFGLEQLPHKGDVLFITGGEKDVMSLYSKGFYAICFNSETSYISADILTSLNLRFRHIILLYDMDKTGKQAAQKLQKQFSDFSLLKMDLPLSGEKKEKDISDYFRLGYTASDLKKLILELIENIYQNTLSMIKSCEIDYSNPPKEPQHIVSVNGVPLGTAGNLLCVTGGEGTGKSNFVSAMIAGAVLENRNKNIDTLGFHVFHNQTQKAVILYDTEQSESQLFKNVSNALRRAELNEMPNFFKAFYLATMSRKERLESIRNSMDLYYHRYGGIQFVVIDGIADLVRSVNDEIESVALVDELYRMAAIYSTCIVGVLHFVPNGMKLRGHIGSEMQRKSAGILSIEQDDIPGVSVVKALKVRAGSPLDVPLIQFSWDKSKQMHSYFGEKSKEDKDKRKERELTKIAKDIFSQKHHLTYQNLVREIEFLIEVKERTAKSYIRYMREKKIVIKDPSNANYYIIGLNL